MLEEEKQRDRSITERTVQDIIDMITDGELKKGDKLPSERELAEKLAVGRPTIREALRIADAFGIVDIRKYDGIYVAGSEPAKISAPFKVRMEMGQFNLAQLFEMRRIFEVEIIKIAAERIDDATVAQLEDILDREDVHNAVQFAKCDSEFHTNIYKSTGNEFLVMIMQIVNELSSISRKVTGRFEETRKIVHNDHIAILEGLRNRDVQKCADSMLQHIDHLQKIIELDTKVYESVFQHQLKSLINAE